MLKGEVCPGVTKNQQNISNIEITEKMWHVVLQLEGITSIKGAIHVLNFKCLLKKCAFSCRH